MSTLLIGMCSAWAYGVIMMKIAIAAQDKGAHMRAQQRLLLGAKNHLNPQAWAQDQVYHGIYLDTRVTAVYMCLGLVYIYLLV